STLPYTTLFRSMLVVFGDREYPGRPSLLDPFDPSQLVGEDPGERPSGVRLVLVRVPRDGTVIEEEMRFLTQVDEEYSTVLGNLLGDFLECRPETRLVQLSTAGRAERHGRECRPGPEVSARGAAFGVEVRDQVASGRPLFFKRAHQARGMARLGPRA